MACMDLNCFSVSGSRQARTMTVRTTMARPHSRPMSSWKNLITASKALINGWIGFVARTYKGLGVVGGVVMRRRPEQPLGAHRVVAAVAERIAAQEAPRCE